MYAEDNLVPLSALQHYVVCPRQCALIHLEQTWIENTRTAEGRLAHERVDRGGVERCGGVRRTFSVPLRSLRLGLAGRADSIEFHVTSGGELPFPVEYKRGRPKKSDEDRVQLCAQALCLEEMLNVQVPRGALFYGEKRRRFDVVFDNALHDRVAEVAAAVHRMVDTDATPLPREGAPCRNCSLEPACRPDMKGRSAVNWLARRLVEDET